MNSRRRIPRKPSLKQSVLKRPIGSLEKKPQKRKAYEEEYSSSSSEEEQKKVKPNEVSPFKERYSNLLKLLWENERKIEEFSLNKEIKQLFHERAVLFIEYFVSTSTFDPDINLDKHLINFESVTRFI